MKLTRIALPVAILLSQSAFADKLYVRGEFARSLGMQEISFGLSAEQRERIFELSKGEVDLREIFVTKISENKNMMMLPGERHSDLALPPSFSWPWESTGPSAYDPVIQKGWWQQAHKVDEAWKMATGKGVTIADCDAGYYITEPDLVPNLVMEHARDFADKENPTKIDDGNYVTHGTSVAAIMIGAKDGNGINGMAPDAKLIPLQNYNYSELDDVDKEEATAACIIAAVKMPDVKIIVLENQTHGSSETFMGTREAVRLALKAGVTIVSAGGNSTNELKEEEADDTGSIIVGAINKNHVTEYFSNFGSRVSIAAYGSGLLTLSGPSGKLGSFGGTSGATPQVASAVALMLEVNPNLTPAQVKEILIATRNTTEENKNVGGALNLLEALNKAKETEGDKEKLGEAQAFRSQLVDTLTTQD